MIGINHLAVICLSGGGKSIVCKQTPQSPYHLKDGDSVTVTLTNVGGKLEMKSRTKKGERVPKHTSND